MIRKDRELLAQLAALSRELGQVVGELLYRQDVGELSANDGLSHADELDTPSFEPVYWPGATPGATSGAARAAPDAGRSEGALMKPVDEEAARRHLADAEAVAGSGPDVAPRPVERVGVVGVGTMGSTIATVFLQAGLPVTVVERAPEALAKGVARIQGIQDKAVARGKADRAEADRRMAALNPSNEQDALADCDLVIEAVFEDLAIKADLLATLAELVGPNAVLATNTSYLDVNRLAEASGRPGDVVGMHFFSPAHLMRLLEVVRGAHTADDTLATALALGRRVGKLPIIASVGEGFVANRIFNAYRVQCEFMVEEGARPEQVDIALEEFGFAMGPFATWDLSGLDIALATRARLAETRDPRERTPRVLGRLCDQGRFGRKTGAGWYRYDEAGRRGPVDSDVRRMIEIESVAAGISRRAFTAEEIVRRVLGTLVNEAALVLAEGIAERASDIDLVLVNGYGFPKWVGGPLFWARSHRADVLAGIDAAAEATGFGFRRGDVRALLD